MNLRNPSRRQFTAALGVGAAALTASLSAVAARAQSTGKTLLAGEIIDRVKSHLGVPWNPTSYRDTYKIGGPDTPVKGIATSFGANLRVMQLANRAGLNMIITHEPTFWSDPDTIALVQNDALYRLKRGFGDKNGMVVWRIHDHWHARKPFDGIRTGWNRAMGWDKYQVNGDLSTFEIPPTTLGELARYVAKTLDTKSLRIIGDPNLPVRLVGRGGHPLDPNMIALPKVDVIIVSEAREYDSFEYVRDMVRTGAKKGAIFISHTSGEDEGMHEFATWAPAFIPELPIKYIPTTDEFWTV